MRTDSAAPWTWYSTASFGLVALVRNLWLDVTATTDDFATSFVIHFVLAIALASCSFTFVLLPEKDQRRLLNHQTWLLTMFFLVSAAYLFGSLWISIDRPRGLLHPNFAETTTIYLWLLLVPLCVSIATALSRKC
jgi:hypothetical protein